MGNKKKEKKGEVCALMLFNKCWEKQEMTSVCVFDGLSSEFLGNSPGEVPAKFRQITGELMGIMFFFFLLSLFSSRGR